MEIPVNRTCIVKSADVMCDGCGDLAELWHGSRFVTQPRANVDAAFDVVGTQVAGPERPDSPTRCEYHLGNRRASREECLPDVELPLGAAGRVIAISLEITEHTPVSPLPKPHASRRPTHGDEEIDAAPARTSLGLEEDAVEGVRRVEAEFCDVPFEARFDRAAQPGVSNPNRVANARHVDIRSRLFAKSTSANPANTMFGIQVAIPAFNHPLRAETSIKAPSA